MIALDLTEQVFGRLIAKAALTGSGKKKIPWLCECRCGNITTASAGDLRNGHTQSCGCQKKDWKPAGEAARHAVMCGYRCQAQNRGHVWKLTVPDFIRLTSATCAYCGAEPSSRHQSRNGNFIYNGIDRVDNLQGYTTDNTVSCCSTCNRAKDVMSVDDFLKWVSRIAQYRGVN